MAPTTKLGVSSTLLAKNSSVPTVVPTTPITEPTSFARGVIEGGAAARHVARPDSEWKLPCSIGDAPIDEKESERGKRHFQSDPFPETTMALQSAAFGIDQMGGIGFATTTSPSFEGAKSCDVL